MSIWEPKDRHGDVFERVLQDCKRHDFIAHLDAIAQEGEFVPPHLAELGRPTGCRARIMGVRPAKNCRERFSQKSIFLGSGSPQGSRGALDHVTVPNTLTCRIRTITDNINHDPNSQCVLMKTERKLLEIYRALLR